MNNIILGTAGHIDHGKTTLIKALTGINADRLNEEKKRGITIDLGFAHMILPSGRQVGIVDVPGHERFIKNMVAGAGGIDVVLMIIAADEGVMPQTQEHLNILNILNVEKGLTVITKTDMVESDWLQLVLEDVREEIKGTFLEKAPIIPVSSITGEGIRELISEIDKICDEKILNDIESPFRLPVDRIFTLAGIGTVVTGGLLCGRVNVGDEVEIFPKHRKARVRTIEVHGTSTDEALAGQRTALNMTDVKVSDIQRGDVISETGTLLAVNTAYVYFHLLKDAQTLKNRRRIRFHTGTKEVMARMVLLDKEKLMPGDNALAKVIFEEPITCVYKDKYVVRSYSPMTTIGGGEILFINPKKIKKKDREKALKALEQVHQGDLSEFILGLLRFFGKPYLRASEITPYTGKSLTQLERIISKQNLQKNIVSFMAKGETIVIDNVYYDILSRRALSIIEAYHKEQPLKDGIGKEELRSKLKVEPEVFENLLFMWQDADILETSGNNVKQKGFTVTLSQDQHQIAEKILKSYAEGGWSPSTLREIISKINKGEEEIKQVLRRLVKEDKVVKLTDELFMSRERVDKALYKLQEHFRLNRQISVAEFRTMLGTTRKFALPLLEYMDSIKATKRAGDGRIQGSNLFKAKD